MHQNRDVRRAEAVPMVRTASKSVPTTTLIARWQAGSGSKGKDYEMTGAAGAWFILDLGSSNASKIDLEAS